MIANDNDFVFAIFMSSKEEDAVCTRMCIIFFWVESILANRNIDNTIISSQNISRIFSNSYPENEKSI